MRRADAELRRDRPRRLVDSPKPGGRDEGIAFVTVAISLLVLLGMAALAIDGSNLYRERGDAQNAADLAAYAAAYNACTGGADPVNSGRAQAKANGFDDDDPDITVDVSKDADGWRAEVSADADRYFSKVLGADVVNIAAEAVVRCIPGAGPGGGRALFAGGYCTELTGLKWSGSNNVVDGGIHTNDDIRISGSGNTITGKAGYVTYARVSGSGNDFQQGGGPLQDGWRDWPVGHRTKDFMRGGRLDREVAAADIHRGAKFDLKEDDVKKGGVYIATEEITVSVSDVSGKLTLITLPEEDDKGVVQISGSNVELEPFWEDVLVFSDYHKGGTDYPYTPRPYASQPDCGGIGVKVSGSNNQWKGLLIAPRSTAEISGSNNTELHGGVVAWALKLNGSQLKLSGGLGKGGSENRMELVR